MYFKERLLRIISLGKVLNGEVMGKEYKITRSDYPCYFMNVKLGDDSEVRCRISRRHNPKLNDRVLVGWFSSWCRVE